MGEDVAVNMDLQALIADIRAHPGITRKKTISEVLDFFPLAQAENVLASYGEDAAVIAYGEDDVLLLAADGIMETLMKANPFFAGYYSILVNLNDISAMGGVPLAMVDVISMKEERICGQVMRGMETAVRKFGVPVVGGHTHPDCNYDAVDVAILGSAKRSEVIYSHTARAGDDIIFAMDLDGFYPEKLNYAWDTTSKKDAELVRKQMMAMNHIGRRRLARSGKDMSNPGSLGTLGMLLETSGKGGTVDLDKVPTPKGVPFAQWLKSYQGCGFVLTCAPKNSQSIIELFGEVGVAGAVVGKVDATRKIVVHSGREQAVLFDFESEIITGCDPSRVPCSPCNKE
ncbi:MAG TPA: methanogenesis marker 2 protein [Methanomassiliicoccales archaeon]|nr:methanogenesis marker 2 protein [Methanomassiliicoccales archaeon]